MENLITSAGLYFEAQTTASVPWSWVERSIRILNEVNLPVREFALNSLNGPLKGLFDFNQHIERLREEIKRGVQTLGLYSNREKTHDLVMDWQGLAYIDMAEGDCFLGLPQSSAPSPSSLLHRAYTLSLEASDPTYGIAYFHRHLQGPDLYAIGITANPDPEMFANAEALARGDKEAKWFDEMRGARRHLRGWFRGAYPASLLSDDHVNMPLARGGTLLTVGIGKLSHLGTGRWLWELSEHEIPLAQRVLDQSRLLVCS